MVLFRNLSYLNTKIENTIANSIYSNKIKILVVVKKIQTTSIQIRNNCTFEIQKIIWKTIYKN
jgi:hypothetical protein